jgi:hypothetical protein
MKHCFVSLCCAAVFFAQHPVLAGSVTASVELPVDAQKRVGIVTRALEAVREPMQVETLARVLDPSPLVQLDTDIVTARSALTVSRAEAVRTRKLYADDRNASGKALEGADAQFGGDQARAAALGKRLMLEWGTSIASMSADQRSALTDALASGKAMLVRVEIPQSRSIGADFDRVVLDPADGGDPIEGKIIGPVMSADPKLLSRGVLARIDGAQPRLALGSVLSAHLLARHNVQEGVMMPRSALIRLEGAIWVYVQLKAESFERRELKDASRLPAGWFVAEGFAPGEHVVVEGAMELLAAERAASLPAGDSDSD